MANLQLTELPRIENTHPQDLLYQVQFNESKQIALSSFFINIPSSISIQTGYSITSAGQEITNLYDERYAFRSSIRKVERIGDQSFPTPGVPLSGFGNFVVLLSGSKAITVNVPKINEGSPADNWEIEIVQTGPAPVYITRSSDGLESTKTTFFGTGSGIKPGAGSAETGSLSVHQTPGQFGSIRLVKLETIDSDENRWLALTANG